MIGVTIFFLLTVVFSLQFCIFQPSVYYGKLYILFYLSIEVILCRYKEIENISPTITPVILLIMLRIVL